MYFEEAKLHTLLEDYLEGVLGRTAVSKLQCVVSFGSLLIRGDSQQTTEELRTGKKPRLDGDGERVMPHHCHSNKPI